MTPPLKLRDPSPAVSNHGQTSIISEKAAAGRPHHDQVSKDGKIRPRLPVSTTRRFTAKKLYALADKENLRPGHDKLDLSRSPLTNSNARFSTLRNVLVMTKPGRANQHAVSSMAA